MAALATQSLTRTSILILFAATFASAAGCSQRSARMTVEPEARGCVVMIPGVVGQAKQLDSTCETLREAGVAHRFEVIGWGTSAFQPIENLTDLPANEKRADATVALGTLVFGTIDRRNAISAGHSGFVDDAGRKCADDKLEQIAWNPTWLLLGHYGGHMGYRGAGWIRDHLAPTIDPTLADTHDAIADRDNETDRDDRLTRRPEATDASPA